MNGTLKYPASSDKWRERLSVPIAKTQYSTLAEDCHQVPFASPLLSLNLLSLAQIPSFYLIIQIIPESLFSDSSGLPTRSYLQLRSGRQQSLRAWICPQLRLLTRWPPAPRLGHPERESDINSSSVIHSGKDNVPEPFFPCAPDITPFGKRQPITWKPCEICEELKSSCFYRRVVF